jgi:hypothetical protein
VTGVGIASDEFFDAGEGEVVGITLLFALVGAAVGTVVGSGFEEWQTVYRAPRDVRAYARLVADSWQVGIRLRY